MIRVRDRAATASLATAAAGADSRTARIPSRFCRVIAPGAGDPPTFTLGDCSTQRNLDDTGREQAARLGERLAKAGVARARVYSSQWCRCLETARLLNLGPVEALPALNSFFNRPQDRAKSVAALRAFLAGLPVGGTPVVLVTHQVTIGAFTLGGAGLLAASRHETLGWTLLAVAGGQLLFHVVGDLRRRYVKRP